MDNFDPKCFQFSEWTIFTSAVFFFIVRLIFFLGVADSFCVSKPRFIWQAVYDQTDFLTVSGMLLYLPSIFHVDSSTQ